MKKESCGFKMTQGTYGNLNDLSQLTTFAEPVTFRAVIAYKIHTYGLHRMYYRHILAPHGASYKLEGRLGENMHQLKKLYDINNTVIKTSHFLVTLVPVRCLTARRIPLWTTLPALHARRKISSKRLAWRRVSSVTFAVRGMTATVRWGE